MHSSNNTVGVARMLITSKTGYRGKGIVTRRASVHGWGGKIRD